MNRAHQDPEPAFHGAALARAPAPVAPQPVAVPARAAPSAFDVLALQRQAGNQAVVRMLARQPQPAPPPAAPPKATLEEAIRWPEVLPRAAHGQNKLTTTRHATKIDPTVEHEAEGGPAQKNEAICNFIADQRRVDSSMLTLREWTHKTQQGQVVMEYGYVSADPGGTKDTPTDVKTPAGGEPTNPDEQKRLRAKRAVWKEFSHEGGSNAINAWDNARVTWGRGMAASGGQLQDFAQRMLDKDPAVRRDFLKFGINVVGKQFHVVNTANGAIEVGDEALELLEGKKELLASLVALGNAHHQELVDAQWAVMKDNAANVPDWALDWSEEAIQLVAHMTHGGSAYGWAAKAKDAANRPVGEELYKATNGDIGKILSTWGRLRAGKPEANGVYLIASQDHHMVELRAWGGGAGAAWIGAGASGPLKVDRATITSRAELSDHVALLLPGGLADFQAGRPASFYIWPRLTPDQEQALGGNERLAKINWLNGQNMYGMLLELAKLGPATLRTWLESKDIRAQAEAAHVGAGRMWWAIDVALRKPYPLPPAPGPPMMYDDQVDEAYEWLGKPRPKGSPGAGGVARLARAALLRDLHAPGPGERPSPTDPLFGAYLEQEVKQAKLDVPAIAAARQAAQAAAPQGAAVTVGDRSVSITSTWLHLLIRLLHHRAMEMLYAARTSDAHKGDSPAQARTLAKPYLDEFRAAPYPNRFEYRERRDIEDDLRALIQLEALGLAEEEYANQNAAGPDPMNPGKSLPNAEARARSGGSLPGNDAWCGAFAFSNARQAGANPFLAQYIQGEGGIVSLGGYGYDHWINVDGGWMKVEKYHKEVRNSPRSYLELPAQVTNFNLDIQPGDLVLLDNRWGTRADHIMMVKSYDKTTGHLEKVAGNEGATHPINVGGYELKDNPAPNDATPPKELQKPFKDMSEDEKKQLAEFQAKHPKNVRIHGRFRWSLVDFETHQYRNGKPPGT